MFPGRTGGANKVPFFHNPQVALFRKTGLVNFVNKISIARFYQQTIHSMMGPN